MAQPEINKIACMMRDLYKVSNPNLIRLGEWHLPYVTPEDRTQFDTEDLVLLSAGRCGKVSYLTHGITDTPESDIDKAKNKMVSNKHWSVTEHPSTPLKEAEFLGNFRGWKQWRKFYHNESGEI